MKLVTGGSGYLGAHLARALLDRGETVRVFDLQRSKYLPDGADFIAGDMRDMAAARRAVAGAAARLIACYARDREYVRRRSENY